MAISDKLTYLNTTKSQLKDQINYGLPTEKQITSSTTFREYVGSIFEAFLEALRNPDTLFTNLPKTSASGSQITLNGTAYAPMRITLNPTAISQETTLGSNLVDFLNPTNVTQGSYDSTTKVYTSNALTGNWKGLNIYVNATPIILPTGNSTFYYSADIRLKSGTYANNISVMRTGTNLTDVTSSVTGTTNPTISSSFQRYVFKVDYVNSSESEVTYVNHYLQLKTNADNAVLEVKNIMVSKTNTDYEIYTYGASPNPSYPQDIHTISGNNSVVVEGKNLAKSFYVNNRTSAYQGVLYVDFNLEPNTTYTISFNGTNEDKYYFNENIFTTAPYITITNERFTKTLTTKSSIPTGGYIDGQGWLILKNQSGNTNANIFSEVQLEKGSTATTYTPYVSQTNPINLGEYELGTIGDYKNEFVRSGGENLCDYDINTDYTNQYLDNSGNWVTAVGYTYTKQKINITAKTISVSIGSKVGNPNIRIGQFKSDGTFITRTLINTNTNNITLDNNCSYIWLSIDKDTTNNSYFKNISINYGTTALPYVPYEKGWYYKQGIGKVVLDGTESWQERTNSNNVKQFYCDTTLTDVLMGADNMQLCNYAKFNRSTFNWGSVGDFSILDNTKRFYICVNSSTTLSDFKTTIASNNIIAYVQLATPTYTKITGELAQELEQVYKGMLSYDGTTNISQVNNDLAFELVGSAIEELS